VEIDIVLECVGVGVDQRELDIVVLVDDHQRAGNRAVEGHGMDFRAGVIDDDLLFLDGQRELDNLRGNFSLLRMGMDEWRLDEVDLDTIELGNICGDGCRIGRDIAAFGTGRRGGNHGHQSAGDCSTGQHGASCQCEALGHVSHSFGRAKRQPLRCFPFYDQRGISICSGTNFQCKQAIHASETQE
jgi:hypothetical protein